MYPRIALKTEAARFLKRRHPWFFSGALHKPAPELHGKVVSLFLDDRFVCHGYYNKNSQISVRALSWQEDERIDVEFFRKRLAHAFALRERHVLSAETNACRMLFAESDFLPGFILDKYDDVYILQIHTLGAEQLKPLFVQAFLSLITPRALLEKTSVEARKHEGMQVHHKEVLFGEEVGRITIKESGLSYIVDFDEGQKTGFFLDQRENRKMMEKYVKGKRVLNLFSYTGGFSVAALRGGASYVESVDISEKALAIATEHFTLNGFPESAHKEVCADVFEYLAQLPKGSFDVIILDPPAFVKLRHKMKEGLRGYLSLNQKTLERMLPGQVLFSCSCSGAVSEGDFFFAIHQAAENAHLFLQVLERPMQPLDHPMSPYFPEGHYLKSYLVRASA